MKEDFELSNGLTNRAWADMRARLDLEMPIEKKDRPVFWLWLCALLGCAFLGYLYFGLQHESTKKLQSPVAQLTPTKPEVDATIETVESKKQSTAAINKPQETHTEQTPKTRTFFGVKSAETPVLIAKTVKINEFAAELPFEDKAADYVLDEKILEGKTPIVALVSPANEEGKSQVSQNSENHKFETSSALSLLPTGTNSSIKPKMSPWSPATIFIQPIKPNARKLPWQILGLVSVAQNEHVGLTWSGGLGVCRSLHPRWDISTHLRFQQNFYPSKSKFLVVPYQELADNYSADAAFLAANGVETYGTVSGFTVRKTEQLSLDIQPAYKISGPWRLQGQAQLTRTFMSNTRELSNFTQRKSTLNSILQNSDEKWRILLGLGVDLRFSKRWDLSWNWRIAPVFSSKNKDIGLSSNQGTTITDPLSIPDFDDRPQLFEIALRYRITN